MAASIWNNIYSKISIIIIIIISIAILRIETSETWEREREREREVKTFVVFCLLCDLSSWEWMNELINVKHEFVKYDNVHMLGLMKLWFWIEIAGGSFFFLFLTTITTTDSWACC